MTNIYIMFSGKGNLPRWYPDPESKVINMTKDELRRECEELLGMRLKPTQAEVERLLSTPYPIRHYPIEEFDLYWERLLKDSREIHR